MAELARVLRPGGVLIGADSLDNAELREFHKDDVCVPVDPANLPNRLRRSGFSDANVGTSGEALWFVARTAFGVSSSTRVNDGAGY